MPPEAKLIVGLMPDLELDLLRAFAAVADAGSFTGAAEQVARSQSAVSQKIRRLEETIGRPVFDRSSRSLTLTSTGAQLLQGSRRLLELHDDLVRGETGESTIYDCRSRIADRRSSIVNRGWWKVDGRTSNGR